MKTRKPWVSRQVRVPLYGDKILIGVAKDIPELQVLLPKRFRDANLEDYAGLTIYRGSQYAILFTHAFLDHGTLAHEIFHVAHRILEYRGDTFSEKNHEPYAYLQGWVAMWAYRELARNGFKVKHG